MKTKQVFLHIFNYLCSFLLFLSLSLFLFFAVFVFSEGKKGTLSCWTNEREQAWDSTWTKINLQPLRKLCRYRDVVSVTEPISRTERHSDNKFSFGKVSDDGESQDSLNERSKGVFLSREGNAEAILFTLDRAYTRGETTIANGRLFRAATLPATPSWLN